MGDLNNHFMNNNKYANFLTNEEDEKSPCPVERGNTLNADNLMSDLNKNHLSNNKKTNSNTKKANMYKFFPELEELDQYFIDMECKDWQKRMSSIDKIITFVEINADKVSQSKYLFKIFDGFLKL